MKRVKGTVISTKMDKTIVVQQLILKKSPKYNKYTKVLHRHYAHDSNSEAQKGDTVVIKEHRPISKLKRWTLDKVL